MVRREILLPVLASSFCFAVLFSHVVTFGLSPTECLLHPYYCCTAAPSLHEGLTVENVLLLPSQPAEVKTWGHLKTLVLWYNLSWFYSLLVALSVTLSAAPWWSSGHTDRLSPRGCSRVFTREWGRFVYSCHHMNKHQRGRKKRDSVSDSEAETQTQKRDYKVGNRLAGRCFLSC